MRVTTAPLGDSSPFWLLWLTDLQLGTAVDNFAHTAACIAPSDAMRAIPHGGASTSVPAQFLQVSWQECVMSSGRKARVMGVACIIVFSGSLTNSGKGDVSCLALETLLVSGLVGKHYVHTWGNAIETHRTVSFHPCLLFIWDSLSFHSFLVCAWMGGHLLE